MREVTLNYKDYERLKKLRRTFDLNYRLTHLWQQYLLHFPELITKEMVDTLIDGTTLSREEAIGAILGEALLPGNAADPDERTLLREYIYPSIRMMDPKRYYDDLYYKTVKAADTSFGRWQIKNESYAAYRAVVANDCVADEHFRERIPLGFFPEEFEFLAVLEDENEWMTLTPVDMDTSREAIEAAEGRVITFGLGLGYYAFHASEKEGVESVTVIEKSPDVIKLFREHLLPKFPHKEKIRIIEADAFRYAEEEMPKEHYDMAFVDTWRDVSDGYGMYLRMKKAEEKNPQTRFLYWIEDFILSHLRARVFEEIWERESADKTHRGENATGTYAQIEYALSRDGLREEAKKRTEGMFIS